MQSHFCALEVHPWEARTRLTSDASSVPHLGREEQGLGMITLVYDFNSS